MLTGSGEERPEGWSLLSQIAKASLAHRACNLLFCRFLLSWKELKFAWLLHIQHNCDELQIFKKLGAFNQTRWKGEKISFPTLPSRIPRIV